MNSSQKGDSFRVQNSKLILVFSGSSGVINIWDYSNSGQLSLRDIFHH
uniref:Uncharacterized protein n=1 Tax=Lepeophtheirus salmonis TaxID=72036 RepID=A0A0K2TSN6_LEPSM